MSYTTLGTRLACVGVATWAAACGASGDHEPGAHVTTPDSGEVGDDWENDWENCHTDCFGEVVCSEGTVYTTPHGGAPCDIVDPCGPDWWSAEWTCGGTGECGPVFCQADHEAFEPLDDGALTLVGDPLPVYEAWSWTLQWEGRLPGTDGAAEVAVSVDIRPSSFWEIPARYEDTAALVYAVVRGTGTAWIQGEEIAIWEGQFATLRDLRFEFPPMRLEALLVDGRRLLVEWPIGLRQPDYSTRYAQVHVFEPEPDCMLACPGIPACRDGRVFATPGEPVECGTDNPCAPDVEPTLECDDDGCGALLCAVDEAAFAPLNGDASAQSPEPARVVSSPDDDVDRLHWRGTQTDGSEFVVDVSILRVELTRTPERFVGSNAIVRPVAPDGPGTVRVGDRLYALRTGHVAELPAVGPFVMPVRLDATADDGTSIEIDWPGQLEFPWISPTFGAYALAYTP